MAYNDLREWIAALDKAGELKRITAEVDPILEVTEITDRVSKWGARNGHGPGGPALLFENVKGHPGHKIFINQFGSERRMNLALGSKSLDEIAERIHQMMDVKTPQGLLEKIKMLPMLADLGDLFPKRVSTGPCKEVIKRDNFSLLDFPILQCWPQDGGRFITLPCVMTRDPRTGKRNVGMYRMHVYDATTHGHALAAPQERRRASARADARGCGQRADAGQDLVGGHHGAQRRRQHRHSRASRCSGQDGSCGGHRHRSGADVFGHCAGAAGDRGVHDRRLPARQADRGGEVRDRAAEKGSTFYWQRATWTRRLCSNACGTRSHNTTR